MSRLSPNQSLPNELRVMTATDSTNVERLLRVVVTSLVDDPEAVVISRSDLGNKVRYAIAVGPDDVGKVIGRQGRIVKAIRTVARAAASLDGDLIEVDIVG